MTTANQFSAYRVSNLPNELNERSGTVKPDEISPRRILHLSTVDFGGAGAAALQLHRAMCDRGVESILAVWESRSDAPGIISFERAGWASMRRWAGRVWYRLSSRRRYFFRNQRPRILSKRQLTRLASDTQPELIIVHNVSDFASFDDLAFLQKLTGARVVFHLLDMALMTGGCHYSWGCQGYRRRCGHCPALPLRYGRDASARTLAEKTLATNSMDVAVIVPSSQLAADSEGAAVFKDAPFYRIPLGVDSARFGGLDRKAARRKLGIPGDGLLLMFGAQDLADPRKGIDLLFDALKSLKTDVRFTEMGISLLAVGDTKVLQSLPDPGIPVHRLGYVDAKTLAHAYCAADFYLCSSIEDSGPMMVNEAMMSGTPVVGFPIGVLPDLVEEGKTGALAPTIDAAGLAAALDRVLGWNEEKRRRAREECRACAIKFCSLDAQVRAFLALVPSRR